MWTGKFDKNDKLIFFIALAYSFVFVCIKHLSLFSGCLKIKIKNGSNEEKRVGPESETFILMALRLFGWEEFHARWVLCQRHRAGSSVCTTTHVADDGQAGNFLAVHGLLMISVPRAKRLKTVECPDSNISSSYLLTNFSLSVCVCLCVCLSLLFTCT